MDSKNNWPKLSPEAKLQQLRWFRDENHQLRNVNDSRRLYDQDWFIENVIKDGLEQVYMNDIDKNHRF
jgi:hypothetical protein